MKTRNSILAMAFCAIAFVSCKDEKEAQAEKTVNNYVVYVDSLGNVAEADAKANWQAIDDAYQMRVSEAEAAMENMKDKTAAQQKLDAAKAKYEELKAKMETAAAEEGSPKQTLRNALFGEGKIGDDMNFDWVNKDNIHNVYQQFVHTVEDNKDKYTREDWDEIKLMYEALDSRKNTVEKEGLSAEDNRKIAGLKVKFAPMLTVNRIGAKAEEQAEAKK